MIVNKRGKKRTEAVQVRVVIVPVIALVVLVIVRQIERKKDQIDTIVEVLH